MNKKSIIPHWPVLKNVHAMTTTRHMGDIAELCLPEIPRLLHQIHGNHPIGLDNPTLKEMDGDACFSQVARRICAVLTADCLPILLCHRNGDRIAAIHAGWRGLLAGIIDNTIKALACDAQDLLAWLGPAIGPDHFEVNEMIRQDYVNRHPDFAAGFFLSEKHWFGDLYQLAKINLQQCGVSAIYGGGLCTYCDSNRFYSYRRDKGITGRMVSLIWFE
jgi:YfiH family protein